MENDLIRLIQNDESMMNILRVVRKLKLPDCWIGAGFVRNKVWDHLHEYKERTSFSDIDVVYFDKTKVNIPGVDKQIENDLTLHLPEIKWEVVNQAMTHEWHNREPYKDTTEALSEWVETATCVGARITEDNNIQITAPHGLDDLFNLIIKPVPSLEDMDILRDRTIEKQWLKKWPLLKIKLN